MTPTIVKVEVSDIPRNERKKISRMYLFPEGESVMEHLFNRHNRPVDDLKKLVKLALVEAGYELSGLEDVKPKWSQFAGCSCPCSPGFILHGIYGREFFVTVKMDYPKFKQEEA